MRPGSTDSRKQGTTLLEGRYGLRWAERLANQLKSRWSGGEEANLVGVLQDCPQLKSYRSVVLDLAYTEYRHRCQTGEPLGVDEFSRRFPTFERSLQMLIEVQQLLGASGASAASEDDHCWPSLGETFLGFVLMGELGRGTFARVYVASEPALGGRLVALKVAPQGHGEAEVLGRLRHPNIVPVYSVKEDADSGLTAVCMPYLGRTTLCDLLDQAFAQRGPPRLARVVLDTVRQVHGEEESPDEADFDPLLRGGWYVEGVIHILAQLADALAYAHSQGICHRDLKPSNVLLALDGRPLLLDFNLSQDREVGNYRLGGTLPYMAPEQLQSLLCEPPDFRAEVDPRSDLFSLGVIGYELLAGCLPFGPILWDHSFRETARCLLEKQANGPLPLRERNGQVDQKLVELIGRCLAYAPEQRPESAAAVAAALRSQLAPLRRAARWGRLRRKRLTAAGLLLTLVLASGSVGLAMRDPYSVRQFRLGLDYQVRGKHELALACFNQSLQYDPSKHEAWFSRGRAYQSLGNYRQAFEDFQEAHRLLPRGESAACKGYCVAKLKYHAEALAFYDVALRLGFESPALRNNMGFSYAQLSRLREAEESLERALRNDENLPAADHNLLLVWLKRASSGGSMPPGALPHVTRAIAIDPPSADLFCNAAAVCAILGQEKPALIENAIEHLRTGIHYGLEPAQLSNFRVFASLKDHPAFKRLVADRHPTAQRVKADLLLDPLREGSERVKNGN